MYSTIKVRPWPMKLAATCGLVSLWLAPAYAAVVDYSSGVLALSPTHYYELNETTKGVVIDRGISPFAAAHEGNFPPGEVGAPGVLLPGFGDDNRALRSNNAGGVNLGPGTSFATDSMSIAMWFLAPGGVNVGDRLFTNNVERLAGGTEDSFQITLPNSSSPWGIVFAVGQEADMQLAIPTNIMPVQDNRWHHLVVARAGDDVSSMRVVIDGNDFTGNLVPTDATWGTTGSNAHLGMRADEGGSDHNHNGSIDDTAIWLNRALTVEEAQGLYAAAQIPEPAAVSLLALGALVMVRRRRE
ncbi:MAG: hypothetical protein JWL59_3396 [Chthoniobacteraceae bacterium]|nr:hypothetical protein [Chthoniobacteraceae bacterium]